MNEYGLQARRHRQHIVVTAPAEIDLINVSDLSSQLTEACESSELVIVDMTATTFCDSAGVHALARASQLCAANGGEIRLAIEHAAARRVLQLTGLDQVVPVYTDVEQAVSAPRDRSARLFGFAT